MEKERRLRPASTPPPTIIAQSFHAMGKKGRMRMRIVGLVIMAFSGGVPMTAGIFYELSVAYWLFSAVVFFGGFCLLWPEMGLTLIDIVPSGIAKVVPTKLFHRIPEKRGEREEE